MNSKRTTSGHEDFIVLTHLLDDELTLLYGEVFTFYNQNTLHHYPHVILVYDGDLAIGCGAIKRFDDHTMEIKRMYVRAAYRKQGIASLILSELEQWAAELGYSRFVLETGIKQPEAIRVYQKAGYSVIPNYHPYIGDEHSVCMMK